MSYEGPDRRDIDAIIEKAAKEASVETAATFPAVVKETLISIGIDTSDKIGMQRQMSYLRESAHRHEDPEVKKDRDWARRTRQRCEKFEAAVLSRLGGALVMLTIGIIGLAITSYLAGLKFPFR